MKTKESSVIHYVVLATNLENAPFNLLASVPSSAPQVELSNKCSDQCAP